MEILIIEDELKTARALARLITAANAENRIIKFIQSVRSAADFLREGKKPDLIFMDVQLADGLCFEIFNRVQVDVPVIFCTAFDEYMMQAFKANGVDYVLKPFSAETISAALAKVRNLKNFFQQAGNTSANLSQLIEKLQPRSFRKYFLVTSRHKYHTIGTDAVAYFYIRNESTTLVTLDGQQYQVAQSLEEVQRQLDEHDFFRLNRQYLIAFSAIKEVEHYFARKLHITLIVPTDEKLLVGKDKTKIFLSWLGDR
ncbi:LytR/AlgR family response regulator transcription factor [Mucilaginibacter ginsenosidivorans]|uniref:Response regulator transcription factor n=1 Tax=Mucilaginibacter ginsenosidivorans TaxID=398053 RepID=A0A5B8UXY7_9SPHI|nr:LytTR family DNA-binding domain-containing protein [Mucilaginibacter ginsenosidivorans]QEC63758.1 response regulator transcription factor [Mucilaginibacter ginsenosidivorans]